MDDTTPVIKYDKTRVLSDQHPVLEIPDDEVCLVQIYGGDLGRRYPIDAEVTVGRDVQNTIILEMDSVSRRHVRFFKSGGVCRVVDLGSTNGTRVNGVLVEGEMQLRNGDLIKVGGAIFKFLRGNDVEALYHEEIYRMTIIDGLTQVHNKRYFLEFLEREIARSRRHKRNLSLVMFDIDHFKKLNDTYGHLAGDHVLRKIADQISSQLREEDLLARYGGEEFALVLPETTRAAAAELADKVRVRVADSDFVFDDERIRTTISMGVASMERPMAPLELVKLADERLYEAKRGGRNQVVSG